MNLKDKNNNKNESKTQKKFNKGAAIAVATVLSTTLITPLSAHAEGLNNSVNNTSNNIENNNIDHVKVVNEISKGDIAKFGITHSKNLKDIKIVNTAGAVNGKDYTYTSIDNNLLTVNIKKNTSNYNQIISNFKLEGVNKNNNQRIEIPLALSKLPQINLSTTNEESPVSLTLKCTSTNSKENISTTTGANTTDVMYKISYQFKSNTGKDYQITNVKIVPHYKIAYNNPNDMKYKNYLNEALKSLNDNFYSFNTTMGISDFDSTSTGVMILESNYIKSDFNTHLEGTATVYYTIDGKQYKEDVPLQNAKLFGAYDNISQQPQLYYGGQDKKNNAKYVRISIQNPLTNLKYYYIPSQYMMGNPILNITASGGAILSINPQYANDIKYLGNNNYQLTNKLYNSLIETSGLNLFEVSNPHPDQTLQTDISVNSCNYNFPNIKFDSTATLANAYLNLTFTPERGEYAINKHLTVTGYSNNNDQCMLMSGKTTNKNLNDLNKNYNLYSVIMGYSPLLLKMNSTNFINPNYRYVSYPADDMFNTQYYNIESYQSGIYTKDEINNRIYDIVTGKSVSGVTVYSGQQLIDMANSGKQLPNIYMVIAKGTSISDVATTGVANMALGMTPANYADYILVGQAKTDMDNSTLYQGWDKLTDTNRDSIVKDNNKLEGFVLGGIVASYTGENQGNTETFGPSNIMTQTNQSSAIMFSDVRGPGIDTSTAQLSQLGIDPVYTFSGPNGYTTFNMTPEEFYKPTTYYLYSDYKLNPENNVDGAYYTFNIGNNTFTKDSYMEFIYKDNSNNIKHFNVPLSDFSRDSSGDYYYPLSKLPDFKSFNIENDYQAPQSSLLHIQFTTKEPNINQKYYCGILTESGLKNGLVNTLTSINTNNSYINNYMININNKMYNEYQYYGSDPQVTNTNVSINSLANNSCVQKVTNVNRENNTFTINNSIKNNSGLATNYYAIGRIPSNRIKSLASTYGYNGIGKDTYSTMESINVPNGAEVYLIPKSLESKYNDILNTQSISSLSSLSKLITENNSGLVKYKEGMNLNDYIGYIAKSQLINPGQEFDFNIGIKCNGVLKNEKNTMYSGFKYYDSEHSYGSISPIQELNLQNIFQKKVTDSLIQSTKNGEELSGVKYEVQFENGKTATVTSDKNGSVNIPTGIIKKVNVVSVPSGWKVDSNKLDTVNNENEISTTDKVVLSKLNTIVNVSATCNNQDISGVTFDLGKDGNMTTSNKEVSKTFDYNSVNTASIKTIPAGYKADGNISITRTTDKDGNQVINIVQKLTKIPKNSITVSMVNSKGDVIVKPQTVTDYDGSKVLVPSISVPNGYKLVNITDNGQVIDKLPSSITNKNQNIVYHVIKENTSLTIKYMYNGQEIGEPVNKEIATGSIINNNYINAPSGYKVDNITFDGKTVKDNILNEKASVDPNIVIVNLSKLKETVNVSAMCDGKEVPNVVISVNGKNLTTSTGVISEDIPYGSFKDAKVSNIPNGYELNGNISINKTVDKDGNITVNIIQNLKKLATEKVTTEVKDINGNVLVPVTSYSGYEGQNINYKIPTIPKGYEVVKVTDNNNPFTPNTNILHPNTGTIEGIKDTQNIVWIVQNKETTVTVTYKYNNEIIGKPVVTNIKTGSNLDKTKLNIPTGYKVSNIIVNGQAMKNNTIEGTATANPNNIVVNLDKLKTIVNVSATCDNQDVSGVTFNLGKDGDMTTSNKEVSKTFDYNSFNTASIKTIPAGYKVDGNISITKTTDKDGNQVINIAQKLTKIPKNSITVSMVNSQGDVIIKPQTVTDYDGSKVSVPNLSAPNGYKLVNITDNGQVIDKLPSAITNKNQNIVYHVIKENTTVNIKYMYNGQEIGEPVTKNIKTGTEITNSYINTPNGYKIDNITFNGATVKNNELDNKALPTPNTVIVNLSKLKETVNISAVCDGKEVPNVVINVDGKNLTTSTGVISEDIPYGSFKDAKTSNVPNGYELNGNITINKTVDKDGNITINVIQNLKKLASEKVTTEVKDINGNVLIPVTSYSGYEGSDISYKIPTIPNGYEVVKVTDNGNAFTPKTGLLHPNTGVLNDVKDAQHLVWIVQNKETSVTVTYKYNGKDVTAPETTKIKTGSDLDNTKLTIPTGYNIQSITVNGNKMKDNKIVGTASPNPNTIIVNLGKLHETVNVTATCNGVDVGGVIVKANIGDITTGSSVVSKQVDYNSYKSAIVSSIPEGYQQDGKVVVSTSIDKDGNQIVNINVPLKKLSKGTVTTIVKDTTGNIIDAEKSYTGYENTKDTAVVPTIPQGYKVISITNNNIKCDGLPKEFNNSTQNIVWTVEKENTNVTVEVINKDTGKEICTPEIENIKTGSNLGDVKLPNIGDQWKIDSVTVNGQTMKDNKVVGTALPTPNKIIIVVSQKPSVTTEITSDKGNVIVPSKTTIVNEGSSVTPLIPSIPSGYHVDKVKIGDKIYNSIKDIPQTVTKTENINIIVSQNTYTTKVTVKDENGTVIMPTKVITGVSGTSTGLDSSNLIPAGYKVVSVTDNNKPSTINNNAISKITNSNNDIVITVNKEQFNVTTKVIDESNHVIVPSKTTKVDYGSGVDKLIPAVPNGYKLVKYVCNNKDYSNINEIPKTVTSNDNITVIVQKIEKGTINVEVKELNNSTPISTKTYTGDVNSKDTATVPNIPKGYRIVSITNNGQKVNGLPQEFTKETQNVVYQIEKIPTPVQNTKLTIKVENMQGQEIEAPINKEIKVGSKLDNNYMPSIPAKYKIVNVETDNINTGLNINGIAKNGENTIIIKVENKVIKEPVSVTVKDGNSILIPTITKEVNKGTVLNGSFIPNIPTGYKVDSIYVNNSNEGTSLNGEVNGPTNIIVNVSKIVKGSINVTVKDINNNIIVPTKSATGEKGSKDTLNAPIIPSGYKIVSITDNGKVVDGMPKEFTGETQSIIYTVKKINTKVTTEVITQSGQVVTPKNSFDVPTGTSINSLVPNVPSQYKVVGVKVNGKEFTSKADVTGITNGTTENIIVIVNKVVKPVEKEGKVIVEVQGANGNIIVPAVSTTGVSGTADKSSIPSIPVGYKLDYITNNGQKVNGLPEKYNYGTQTIIYHVSKIVNKSTISIVTKSTDGKILVGESSVSGAPGTPTALGLDIPSGYHLVKIIDNGKEIKSLPQKFNNENQNIEIIAEKNKDNIIKPVNNTPNNIPTNTPSNIQNNTPIKTSNNIPTTNTPNISNNNLNNSPITISHNNKTNNPDTNINGKQNPKTGDTSELPFALGILAALGALIGINVKKKKPSTEKIDN